MTFDKIKNIVSFLYSFPIMNVINNLATAGTVSVIIAIIYLFIIIDAYILT